MDTEVNLERMMALQRGQGTEEIRRVRMASEASDSNDYYTFVVAVTFEYVNLNGRFRSFREQGLQLARELLLNLHLLGVHSSHK